MYKCFISKLNALEQRKNFHARMLIKRMGYVLKYYYYASNVKKAIS